MHVQPPRQAARASRLGNVQHQLRAHEVCRLHCTTAVFQVAKTMAPSVIYIDEVEKVFVSDKKKAKEFGGQVGQRD